MKEPTRVNEEVVPYSENELILLSQKVPLKREEESIILDLEKSALASDTLLDSIVFQYDSYLNEQFLEKLKSGRCYTI